MNQTTELTDYMNFQDLLDDEEKLVRETARGFVNEKVMPIIELIAVVGFYHEDLVKIKKKIEKKIDKKV